MVVGVCQVTVRTVSVRYSKTSNRWATLSFAIVKRSFILSVRASLYPSMIRTLCPYCLRILICSMTMKGTWVGEHIPFKSVPMGIICSPLVGWIAFVGQRSLSNHYPVWTWLWYAYSLREYRLPIVGGYTTPCHVAIQGLQFDVS